MFYLTKRQHEDEFEVGDRIMVLADFPAVGVKAGDKGQIIEIYNGGVMVSWLNKVLAAGGGTTGGGSPGGGGIGPGIIVTINAPSDGFGRDELEYLAVETAKHPEKAKKEEKKLSAE